MENLTLAPRLAAKKLPEYKANKKQMLDREGNVHDLTEVKEIALPADIRAQKYWLNNRYPERWSERPESSEEGGDVVSFIPVPERLVPDEAVIVNE